MDIDIDRLITEIEKRPAIWNTKCREYNDRFDKLKQWEEVVNIFSDPFTSVEDKKYQGTLLQKRWRTLRDAFVKQRRELSENTPGASEKKPYKYYNQLKFLLPVVASNTTQNNMASQEDSDSVDTPQCSNSTPPVAKQLKKNNSMEKIGLELVHVLKSTLQQKSEEEDPDRQFMLSLVSDLKSVPPRLKSKVKMNILKCITDAQVDEESYTFIVKNESSP